jgi:hypothetical protein
MRLDVKAFALACGLCLGLGLFLLTWWVILFDGASDYPTFVGRIYRGYALTPVGSVYGLVWGLADGVVGGAIFAWLYNAFAKSGSNRPAPDGTRS